MSSNLLLTGPPCVGKTALILRALTNLPPQAACGIVTRELRRDGRRVGFAVEGLKARPDATLLQITPHNRDERMRQVVGWVREVWARA